MTIQDLQLLYAATPQVGALTKIMQDRSIRTVLLDGLVASSAPLLFGALQTKMPTTMLFIMQDADEAGYFYHDLHQMLGDEGVLFFPSSFRKAVKYAHRDPANEILRTEVLTRLSAMQSGGTGAEHVMVVTCPEALAEKVVSKKKMDTRMVLLETDKDYDTLALTATLREYGFREVDYVYEPGQYALRGCILDVFSYNSEYPYRIDFFDDTIDSIRTFEVDTQLSKEKKSKVEVVPELAAMQDDKVSVLSFFDSERSVLVTKDLNYVREVIDRTYEEGFTRQAVMEQLEGLPEQQRKERMQQLQREGVLQTGSAFVRDALEMRHITLGAAGARRGEAQAQLSFHTSAQPLFHKNFDLLGKTFTNCLLQGFRIYILADSAKQNERLREILVNGEQKITAKDMHGEVFIPVERTLHEGFIDHDARLCIFTDHQIFDRYHKYNLRSDKARGGKVALTLKEIRQFEPGDYVVHIDHGVGRFVGLVRMPQGDTYQEMIKLQYQNGDSIYVSIHSLYKISKYKSQDSGEAPKLSHLGTGQWDRIKERTKKKLKDIARDLIQLYARRRHERGHAFSADSFMQHELEASFLYEDTPDQIKATADVKADMERQRPMDRLVCGDVGFGKTEVAVRAAFKAACDGKQVAVLVPTTVLAYQHYQTFSKRLNDFPVRVDYLTRARSAKQTTALLADLAAGKVDIVVGTHKLIGKQVKFKDLGLLIIDEEQKFGVATKEKLKQMKVNVDTLTMSATPIPRTLQFSLVGARDLSIMQTPPPNRYPIQTEIHTFSAEIVADAIRFELSRNGQVYFVTNRISDLTRLAEMIQKYVPEARVAIGHGQMKPEDLEKIIMDFSNYDFDVLLSTTIVENGIDIPNANTIIINGAHHFGLSDLHQMRGRVGRSNRKAFCYLLAPPLSALSNESRRRLEALENFSDLGSGINIAMQDLDIRGAGNLLGAEQSGFIADLGYETYQKILNQAVTELKNEEFADLYAEEAAQQGASAGHFVEDCVLESDIEMCFPDSYVPGDSERMLLYRELDGLTADDEVERYRTRLIDRFGEIPAVGQELMRVVPLRRHGKELGMEKIILKQGRMTTVFVSNPESPYYRSAAFDAVLQYMASHAKRCNLREIKGKRSMVVTGVATVEEALQVLCDIQKSAASC